MRRFRNSWEILQQSWAVLKKNPSLALFPVLSGAATLFVTASFCIPVYFALLHAGIFDHHTNAPEKMANVTTYIGGFLFYCVTYFIVIFFNSALVSCAYKNLLGEETTLSDGFANTAKHLPKILGWTLIAATVGQILRSLQERGGIIGALLGGLAGLAWSLAIYFVIPLMVIENMGPIAALKGSANRIKQTWGEQLILNGGIGLAGGLLVTLPAIAMMVCGIVLAASNLVLTGVVVGALGLIYLLGGMIVLSALTVIYQTALYLYTTTGQTSGWFSAQSMQSAFVPKRSR